MADLISMLAAASGIGAEEADPNFNQTVLLLHGDGTNGAQNNTFLDSSTNNFTITRNGNTTQGTFSPFSVGAGEWSNYFDGTGDYLTSPSNSAFYLSSGDFTVEAWVYKQTTGRQIIVSQTENNAPPYAGWLFYINTSNQLRFEGSNGANINSSTTFPLNQWVHVAAVRSSGTINVYENGVSVVSGTPSISDFNGALTIGQYTSPISGSEWNGYISNLRIVKGTAVYTSAFTPSTTPLTAITNTSLLTCQSNRFVDNSTNAFAITRNGDVRVTPFSPFAPTAAYSAGTNGGSGYFDGTGDYLSIADNAAWDFGANNFTIEGWIFPSGSAAFQRIYSQYASGGDTQVIFRRSNTNALQFVVINATVTLLSLTSSGTLGINAWNHVAITRNGNVFTLYINGVSQATSTTSITYPNIAASLLISTFDGSSEAFNGYISDLRVVKGTAVYTAAFTPPTAPLTAIANTELLLNFTNAGIIDNTGKNNLETVGDAQIDTAVKKYGTGSLEFDGTGDYLVSPASPEINFGTGDFTVEFWLYASSPSAEQRLVQNTNGDFTSTAWIIRLSNSAKIQVALAYPDVLLDSTTTISSNTWYYIALTRLGSSVKLWINGTNEASGTSSGNLTQDRFYIGGFRSATNSEYFTGYIDDLRITKGVARYTANFTPPTAAFPNE